MNLDLGRLVACNVETYHSSKISDGGYVSQCLIRLANAIGMTLLSPPSIHIVPTSPEFVSQPMTDDGGITVQCVISTSHIAFHSWPLQNRFRLVVDSCKPFEPIVVVGCIRNLFAVKRLSVQDVHYEPLPRKVIDEPEVQQAASR